MNITAPHLPHIDHAQFKILPHALQKALQQYEATGGKPSAHRKKLTTKVHIAGQLIHPNKSTGQTEVDPLASQKIGLFTRGCLRDTQIKNIASTLNKISKDKDNVYLKTDKEGKFNVTFDVKHRFYEDKRDIIIKVFENKVPSELGFNERIVNSISVAVPLKPSLMDIGQKEVKLYEVQKDMPTLDLEDPQNYPLDHPNPAFQLKVVAAGVKAAISTLFATVTSFFSPEKASEILAAPNTPPVTTTPENTVEFMLNSLYQAQFRKGEKENEFVTSINWDECARQAIPDCPDLINTKVTLKRENDKLHIVEIQVQKAKDQPWQTFIPGSKGFVDAIDAMNRNSALYQENSMGFLIGEARDHLARGHLVQEALAIAIFRYVKDHPIRNLLNPHLDGVERINQLGAGLIFGEDGLLTLSALPAKGGVDVVIKEALSSFDFLTFHPRKPMIGQHRFAKVQELYWKIVTEVVDQFFNENAEAICSPETWHEIYHMSQFLMKQSMPYRPYEENKTAKGWVDPSEIDQPDIPGRVVYDGHLRNNRPFVNSRIKPDEESLNHLRQLCRFVIFNGTLYHYLVHDSQLKWADPNFASMSLRGNHSGPWGGSDTTRAAKQVLGAKTLVDFEPPTIYQNQFGNIYPALIEKIKQHEKEFLALGYDPSKIPSAIWI